MKVRTIDPASLEGLSPVNNTARLALHMRGETFTSQMPIERVHANHSELPLPMVTPPGHHPDLTGATWGFFSVLGFFSADLNKSAHKARWVVRCACGHYETRKARAITQPAFECGDEDRCFHCDRTSVLRKRANPTMMTPD